MITEHREKHPTQRDTTEKKGDNPIFRAVPNTSAQVRRTTPNGVRLYRATPRV